MSDVMHCLDLALCFVNDQYYRCDQYNNSIPMMFCIDFWYLLVVQTQYQDTNKKCRYRSMRNLLKSSRLHGHK